MNIFKTIAGILGENDDVTIVVTKSAGGRLAVSTNFRNREVTDKARDLIAPFLVSGTPDELDAEYCGIIAEPLEQSSGIQTSMANFEASKKLAQAKSQQASATKGKAENERLAAQSAAARGKPLEEEELTKWEYTREDVKNIEKLNALGKQGWEVTGVAGNSYPTAILKRKLKSSQNQNNDFSYSR